MIISIVGSAGESDPINYTDFNKCYAYCIPKNSVADTSAQ